MTIGAFVGFGQVMADVAARSHADAQRGAGVLDDAIERAATRGRLRRSS